MSKKALGKGLGALIPERTRSTSAMGPGDEKAAARFREVAVERLTPNRFQPRADFPVADLEELAQSIREKGIVQPIVASPSGDGFIIVAGERRWRAAQLAGLKRVPIVVTEVGTDGEYLELALIENIQRQDLNPLEEATAYHRLKQEFHLTQEEIARRVGKDRSSVANFLRLLKLPDLTKDAIRSGEISMGHAKALLGLADVAAIQALTRAILKQGLSVRDVESRVAAAAEKEGHGTKAKSSKGDVFSRNAEERLTRRLATRVSIQRRGKGGRLEIRFHSEEELMRIYDHLMGGEEDDL